MDYVTDTHGLIWYLTNNKKLGRKAEILFERADKGKITIIIPSIVLAEIISICEKKRANLKIGEVFDKIKNSSNYIIYDLSLSVLESVLSIKNIPEMHDRIIVATSLLGGFGLITKDEEIVNSGIVKSVW
ncbi:MAG: PIN domain-containing protein [Nanoarchaeota archaeon]|nr:PIN domain-containing protein [Nanoarchaeota archaeon]MBU2459305.1 PIN domain-containing protein [Nanoarchaeota archaeon]